MRSWVRPRVWTALALGCALLVWNGTALAGTRHYVLNPGSSITAVCRDCGAPVAAPEPLSGSFDVTLLPSALLFDVAAVTDVNLGSESFAVTGTGFLQRLGRDRQAMVVDARVNDDNVLFTSGRRQHADGRDDITIILSSRRTGSRFYVLVISASPINDQPADSDGDRVVDAEDNCPATANPDQSDGDRDAVGDACDRCPETADGNVVTAEGCSVKQLCPCEAADSGEPWASQTSYLHCVARAARVLRREGQISRNQGLAILRRAARSPCGRTVVALN